MYVCGWDGGGTKTEVCVMDGQGAFLPSGVFGPLNINGASPERVAETVGQAVSFMAALPGGLEACGGLVVGMAGASNRNAVETVEKLVRQKGYTGDLRIVGDQEIALAGAIQGHGAVLIAGTGSICFGRDRAGNRFRAGGWGYLIDDCGSGYALGRDMLMAAVRATDGRGRATVLKNSVLEALNAADVGGLITWLYAPATGKKEIAALAPLLLPAMDQGDEVAQAIAEKAARDLADMVIAGWRQANMQDGELAMTGSILTRYAPIRERTEALIHEAFPDILLLSPRRTPAQGAAMMAREFHLGA